MFTSVRATGNYSASLRLLLVIIVLTSLVGEVYFNRHVNPYTYILALVIIPVVFVNSLLVFLLSFVTGMVMTSLGSTLLLVFSALITLLGFLVLYVESSTSIPGKVLASLLAFTPIYILTPLSLISVLVVLVLLVVFSVKEYLRLGKSTVEVSLESRVAHLGELVKCRVVIECPGIFRYMVLEEARSVISGVARSRITLEVPFRCEHLGVNEKSISVLIEDVKGFAKLLHGPYTLVFKVSTKLSELIKKAERFVEKYAVYLSTPRVVKVPLEALTSGLAGDRKALGGMGFTGVSGLGASFSSGGAGKVDVEGSREHFELRDVADIIATESESSSTEESVPVKWIIPWELIREIETTISQIATRSYIGEYAGAREYEPGDVLKHIHWKKSLRRELLEDLYVKMYTRGLESSGGGGRTRVILADLTTTSPSELDLILSALYGELLSELSREKPLTPVHLFIKIPGERELLYVSGKAIDVVLALNKIIQRYSVRALYNYETWRRTRTIKLGGSTGFIGRLEGYYRALGLGLAELLRSRVSEKVAVQLIHSNALAYKYAIIAEALRDAGFIVLK